jgi:hypothetical protein
MTKDVTITTEDGALIISVPREFSVDLIHHAWAPDIIASYPGPYRELRFDLSRCGLLTSGFISQIFQLQEAFKRGGASAVLDRPDPRFVKVLETVGIRSLFQVVERT